MFQRVSFEENVERDSGSSGVVELEEEDDFVRFVGKRMRKRKMKRVRTYDETCLLTFIVGGCCCNVLNSINFQREVENKQDQEDGEYLEKGNVTVMCVEKSGEEADEDVVDEMDSKVF
jgi:hypothetical protein